MTRVFCEEPLACQRVRRPPLVAPATVLLPPPVLECGTALPLLLPLSLPPFLSCKCAGKAGEIKSQRESRACLKPLIKGQEAPKSLQSEGIYDKRLLESDDGLLILLLSSDAEAAAALPLSLSHSFFVSPSVGACLCCDPDACRSCGCCAA